MAVVFPPAPEAPPSDDEFRGGLIGCSNAPSNEFPILVNGIERADEVNLLFVSGAILPGATITTQSAAPASVGDGLFLIAIDQDASPRPRVTVQKDSIRWTCALSQGDPDQDCRRI